MRRLSPRHEHDVRPAVPVVSKGEKGVRLPVRERICDLTRATRTSYVTVRTLAVEPRPANGQKRNWRLLTLMARNRPREQNGI
jgi:hypothetical protein